jgi:hypothetical protein
LSIVGDTSGNEIRVEIGQRGTDGSSRYVQIDGLGNTRVNGETSISFEVVGNYSLDMELGGGGDTVNMVIPLTLGGPSFLTIDTGAGNDVVDVSVPNGGDLYGFWGIFTGKGNDRVTLRGAATDTFVESLLIRTGNGDDQVTIDGEFSVRLAFVSSLELGLGKDKLTGGTVGSFTGGLHITGGDGFDTVINPNYFQIFQTVDPLTLDFEQVLS